MTSAVYVKTRTRKTANRTNQTLIRDVSMSSAAVLALHGPSFILPRWGKHAHVEEPGENHPTPPCPVKPPRADTVWWKST